MAPKPIEGLRLRRDTGLEVSEDGSSASLKFQHLYLRDFDSRGNISILSVAKLFEMVRGIAWVHPKFLGGFFIGRSAFTVVMAYDFKSVLYNRLSGFNMYKPLTATVSFLSAGKTSLIMLSHIIDPKDGEILATLKFKYVAVNRETRKAAPIPVGFHNRYPSDKSVSLGYDIPSITNSQPVYSNILTVMPSDTDHNGHVNNNSFLRYSSDCAAVAMSRGYLPKLQQKNVDLLTQKLNVSYRKECLEGDTLKVGVWQDDQDPCLLHFDITKDSQTVFASSMSLVPKIVSHL